MDQGFDSAFDLFEAILREIGEFSFDIKYYFKLIFGAMVVTILVIDLTLALMNGCAIAVDIKSRHEKSC
jgi:hypothetical protein